jgi:hypothetical protein
MLYKHILRDVFIALLVAAIGYVLFKVLEKNKVSDPGSSDSGTETPPVNSDGSDSVSQDEVQTDMTTQYTILGTTIAVYVVQQIAFYFDRKPRLWKAAAVIGTFVAGVVFVILGISRGWYLVLGTGVVMLILVVLQVRSSFIRQEQEENQGTQDKVGKGEADAESVRDKVDEDTSDKPSKKNPTSKKQPIGKVKASIKTALVSIEAAESDISRLSKLSPADLTPETEGYKEAKQAFKKYEDELTALVAKTNKQPTIEQLAHYESLDEKVNEEFKKYKEIMTAKANKMADNAMAKLALEKNKLSDLQKQVKVHEEGHE